MPIKYDELMALKNLGQKYAYSDREVMLYAYGIGLGADLADLLRDDLRALGHLLGVVRVVDAAARIAPAEHVFRLRCDGQHQGQCEDDSREHLFLPSA